MARVLMNTTVSLTLLVSVACGPKEQIPESYAVDEIVSLAAEAWGGTERIAAIGGLRAEITYEGHGDPVTIEIGRPNQVRSTGGERYVSVFDGERAAFLHQINRDGEETGPHLVNMDEVKDWELEMAWIFPAFFDHPAEYQGMESSDGVQVHVLRVALPLGAQVDYYIDGETFTVLRAEATATIGEMTYTSGRIYSDHQVVDGVLFPTRMQFFYGDGEPQEATIDVVEFGVTFPEGHFAIPDDLG
jgi:hypothetical protein